MKRIAALILCATATTTAAASVYAQPAGATRHLTPAHELFLNDGSKLYGTVVSETDTEIVFRTAAGAVITAPRDRIVSLRPIVGRMIDGEFRREDPNNTRLFFAPTGRALARGEVYLGMYEFMMPFVQVGITDRISLGGGTPLVFGFGDESHRPYWVTPKVQLLSRGDTHVAAGMLHGFSFEGEGLGIAYGVMTQELRSGSVTLGAGMGYTSDGDRGAVVMIGADAPARRNMKLVTENYLWNAGGIASVGLRFFGENLSADFGLGLIFVSDGVLGGPVVNFVYRF